MKVKEEIIKLKQKVESTDNPSEKAKLLKRIKNIKQKETINK